MIKKSEVFDLLTKVVKVMLGISVLLLIPYAIWFGYPVAFWAFWGTLIAAMLVNVVAALTITWT